jgi:alpha-mannosidase
VRLALTAESALLRVAVSGRNRLRNHRLRLGFRTTIANADVWADAAFGPVRRVPLRLPEEDMREEVPPPTAPLHRYVSLFDGGRGATIFSDGLAEYEATEQGDLFLTLVRAVGALSRSDLPERPGRAGWPAPTPKAQSIGPFAANFALLLHGPRNAESVDAVERAADDALLPLEGRTLRASRNESLESLGVELLGAGLAFSTLKESENGEWLVARCVNLLDAAVNGSWRFGLPIREAVTARLDETPGEPLRVSGDVITFQAPARAVTTILVR